MTHVFCLGLIVIVAAKALAGPDLVPISGPLERWNYDLATGRVTPIARDGSSGRSIWAATESPGFGCWRPFDVCDLDWGDIPRGVAIGGFDFGYYSDSGCRPPHSEILLAFYQNEDGWNSERRQILACYTLSNLPGGGIAGVTAHVIHVDLPTPIVIDGEDLDGDQLSDFGYVYWHRYSIPYVRLGPLVADVADPNTAPPPTCPGVVDAFDKFADPDFTLDPNMNLNLPGGPAWLGSYWFGGEPFAQYYLEMYTAECPEAGASGGHCAGDIGNFNCVVDLADLAQLLGHYGESPAAYWMGDIYPDDPNRPGDGVVDLNDLAAMLGQYGEDCTGSQ
jgi:hypothetical protein